MILKNLLLLFSEWRGARSQPMEDPRQAVATVTVLGPIIHTKGNQYGVTITIDGPIPGDMYVGGACSPLCEYTFLLSFAHKRPDPIELIEGYILSQKKRVVAGRTQHILRICVTKRFSPPFRFEV